MIKKNYSYTYLLPLVGTEVPFVQPFLAKVKNTYIVSNKHVDGAYFFVLCNFDYSEGNSIDSDVTSSTLYRESHYIGNDILYVFRFPDNYLKEYSLFKSGVYSKFSFEAKKTILRFWTELYGKIPEFVTGPLLKIKQILHKDDKLRLQLEEELSGNDKYRVEIPIDSELGNKIYIEEEEFIFPTTRKIDLKTIKDII